MEEPSWESVRDRLYALAKTPHPPPGSRAFCLDALDHPRWEVRAEAVHTLGTLPPDAATARAVARLHDDDQQIVRQVVARSLTAIGTEEQLSVLETLLNDAHPVVRKRAAEAIAALWDTSGKTAP